MKFLTLQIAIRTPTIGDMPRQRRPKTVGKALIPGLRMDPDLARAFTHYAETQAEAHDTGVNYTAAARDLLRRALGMNPEHSCRKEGYFAGVADWKRKLQEIDNG